MNNINDSMPPDEAQKLEWYFSSGKSTFARSLTGPMLSKAELYSSGTYPCYKCHDTPGINFETGDWCKYCNGTGFKSFTLGYNKEITARPTAEVIEAKGYEPDSVTLMEYGRIARRLDKVIVSMGKLGIAVLEAYHGDVGSRWGRQRQGRLFALIPFTNSGKDLLRKIKEDEEKLKKEDIIGEVIAMTPLEKLGVESELLAIGKPTDKTAKRLKLLDKAMSEAEKLYRTVANAWMLSGHNPIKTKKKIKELNGISVKDNVVKIRASKKLNKNYKNNEWQDNVKPAREVYNNHAELKKSIAKENV